ncbi:hypothetical protein DVH24_003965, partial [Malus domestica]
THTEIGDLSSPFSYLSSPFSDLSSPKHPHTKRDLRSLFSQTHIHTQRSLDLSFPFVVDRGSGEVGVGSVVSGGAPLSKDHVQSSGSSSSLSGFWDEIDPGIGTLSPAFFSDVASESDCTKLKKISPIFPKYRDIWPKTIRIPLRISITRKTDNIGDISPILSAFSSMVIPKAKNKLQKM